MRSNQENKAELSPADTATTLLTFSQTINDLIANHDAQASEENNEEEFFLVNVVEFVDCYSQHKLFLDAIQSLLNGQDALSKSFKAIPSAMKVFLSAAQAEIYFLKFVNDFVQANPKLDWELLKKIDYQARLINMQNNVLALMFTTMASKLVMRDYHQKNSENDNLFNQCKQYLRTNRSAVDSYGKTLEKLSESYVFLQDCLMNFRRKIFEYLQSPENFINDPSNFLECIATIKNMQTNTIAEQIKRQMNKVMSEATIEIKSIQNQFACKLLEVHSKLVELVKSYPEYWSRRSMMGSKYLGYLNFWGGVKVNVDGRNYRYPRHVKALYDNLKIGSDFLETLENLKQALKAFDRLTLSETDSRKSQRFYEIIEGLKHCLQNSHRPCAKVNDLLGQLSKQLDLQIGYAKKEVAKHQPSLGKRLGRSGG